MYRNSGGPDSAENWNSVAAAVFAAQSPSMKANGVSMWLKKVLERKYGRGGPTRQACVKVARIALNAALSEERALHFDSFAKYVEQLVEQGHDIEFITVALQTYDPLRAYLVVLSH